MIWFVYCPVLYCVVLCRTELYYIVAHYCVVCTLLWCFYYLFAYLFLCGFSLKTVLLKSSLNLISQSNFSDFIYLNFSDILFTFLPNFTLMFCQFLLHSFASLFFFICIFLCQANEKMEWPIIYVFGYLSFITYSKMVHSSLITDIFTLEYNCFVLDKLVSRLFVFHCWYLIILSYHYHLIHSSIICLFCIPSLSLISHLFPSD